MNQRTDSPFKSLVLSLIIMYRWPSKKLTISNSRVPQIHKVMYPQIIYKKLIIWYYLFNKTDFFFLINSTDYIHWKHLTSRVPQIHLRAGAAAPFARFPSAAAVDLRLHIHTGTQTWDIDNWIWFKLRVDTWLLGWAGICNNSIRLWILRYIYK